MYFPSIVRLKRWYTNKKIRQHINPIRYFIVHACVFIIVYLLGRVRDERSFPGAGGGPERASAVRAGRACREPRQRVEALHPGGLAGRDL